MLNSQKIAIKAIRSHQISTRLTSLRSLVTVTPQLIHRNRANLTHATNTTNNPLLKLSQQPSLPQYQRCFSTVSPRLKEVKFEEMDEDQQEQLTEERGVDTVDVCIVGGGPAGLATAIKLKQLDENEELRVVVLEKAPDMGSHILSGAILEPRALRELFPDSEHYENEQGDGIPLPADLVTKVTEDHVKLLFGNGIALPVPEPPQMSNKNKNYIASLSEVVKYMSEKAEELGVEIYPNTAISELVYDSKGHVKGVATKDMGVSKDGTPSDNFERGMEFHARLTVLAEGCHGSLSKQVINKFDLRANSSKQTYGIGIKEVWEVKPENFKKGFVSHTMGYPLDKDTYGGGFQYHFGDGLVTVGLVVGLDYKNPWVSPYQEFQKMKQHPFYKKVLEGGKCISYGARALNEGGYQSVPQLNFPGGVLVGAPAGFMNVPKIKGSHTAMKSGMLAAECIFPEVLKLKEQQEAAMAAEKEEANEEKDEEEEEEEDEDDEEDEMNYTKSEMSVHHSTIHWVFGVVYVLLD
ncbi:unnamed protein product [Ambrosiozyma monospora]|uniref:Unnamed protein product n=1 Tax=Ambrosiozyma monospora TaxID=43982 RepID=A0ACB5T8J9_AMBMO|nr:unnamed protein product [Ambrosiozyma monospora]